MKQVTGDIWDVAAYSPIVGGEADHWVCVPTNTTLNSKGELVMGVGVAKQAADRFPSLPGTLGRLVPVALRGFVALPGLGSPSYAGIVAFPTKKYWKHPSTIELLRESLSVLAILAEVMPQCKFYLPRPGCGRGGLNWEKDVEPLLVAMDLPDNMVLVHRPEDLNRQAE